MTLEWSVLRASEHPQTLDGDKSLHRRALLPSNLNLPNRHSNDPRAEMTQLSS